MVSTVLTAQRAAHRYLEDLRGAAGPRGPPARRLLVHRAHGLVYGTALLGRVDRRLMHLDRGCHPLNCPLALTVLRTTPKTLVHPSVARGRQRGLPNIQTWEWVRPKRISRAGQPDRNSEVPQIKQYDLRKIGSQPPSQAVASAGLAEEKVGRSGHLKGGLGRAGSRGAEAPCHTPKHRAASKQASPPHCSVCHACSPTTAPSMRLV